jgi:hypothetical protein
MTEHRIVVPEGHRDGVTYEASRDGIRLNRQARVVAGVMKDGLWRSLREIADQTGQPEASVSARLRDLRKARFGGSTVERRRRDRPERGIFEYRLLPSPAILVLP